MSISISDNSTQTLAETHEQGANKGVSAPPPDSQSSKKLTWPAQGLVTTTNWRRSYLVTITRC
jgi:hypothetical protein